MKKLIALLLVFAMLFSVATLISGCDEPAKKKGSSGNKDSDDEEEEEDDEKDSDNEDEDDGEDDDDSGNELPAFDADTIVSQLVVQEYHYATDWTHAGVLLIENPTDFELTVYASATFYDSADGELETVEVSDYLGKGSQAVLELACSYMYARMEYSLTVEQEEWETSAASALTWESVSADEKEIISVTNNGDKTVSNVDVTVLFWNDDKLVYTNGDWLWDVKAGKTAYAEAYCFEEYDRIQVVISGSYSRYAMEEENGLDEDAIISQLDVQEYRYVDYWEDHYSVLVVTNHSDKALDITATVRFYDDADQLMGVDEDYCENIGSGAKGVMTAYQNEEFARIEYELSVQEESWGKCAASSISLETVRYGDKELITVTNHSQKDTVEPECTVLFWGDDGSLVGVESADFWSLEPGQSTTVEVVADDTYAEAEIISNAVVYENFFETDTGDFDALQAASKLKTNQHTYEDYYGWQYLLLVVENTSKEYLELSAEVKFYNEANQLIGACYSSSQQVASGNKTVLHCSNDMEFARIEYQFQVSKVTSYEPADFDLSWTANGSSISVTHNGSQSLSSAQAHIVFWKDGAVIDYSDVWLWGLEAGATQTEDFYVDDYDELEVYLCGGYPAKISLEYSAIDSSSIVLDGEQWQQYISGNEIYAFTDTEALQAYLNGEYGDNVVQFKIPDEDIENSLVIQ